MRQQFVPKSKRSRSDAIVTLQERSIIGTLNSAVMETLRKERTPHV
jgi:transketolase C-terminal domain/subunit